MDGQLIGQILRLSMQYEITLNHLDHRLCQNPNDISIVSDMNLSDALAQLVHEYGELKRICDDKGITMNKAIDRNFLGILIDPEPIKELVEWTITRTEQVYELNNA